MPLKRTPPTTPARLVEVSASPPVVTASNRQSVNIQPGNALTPDLSTTTRLPQQQQHFSPDPSQNVTIRKKSRPQVEDNMDILNNFMQEMRDLFSQFKKDQENKADRLYAAVENIQASIDFLSKNFETLQTRIESLEEKRKVDMLSLRTVEEKLESLERVSRSSCLEIRNIPMIPSETKSSLLDTFIKTGHILNIPIEKTDVKDIFRVKTKDPSARTVIVDLCSTLKKEQFIEMYRKFNKGSSRLSTEHLRISGQSKPIFISENLTSKMKRLFFLARDYAKRNEIKFCWISHGKIFLKRRENGPLIRVTKESDLTEKPSLS